MAMVFSLVKNGTPERPGVWRQPWRHGDQKSWRVGAYL